MTLNRRDLLLGGAAIGGALLVARGKARAAAPASAPATSPRPTPAGWRDDGTVVVPNGARAPWHVVDGVKVFHLVAEPVVHEIVPGVTIEAWGYNGRTPGPLIEVTEGDRCRFYVTNGLVEPTTIHWHGMALPNGMDGVAGLTQKPIPPGETYVYEFPMTRAGTFMYHPHFDEMVQIALGMEGMIVVHPRAAQPRARDYAILLSEWKVTPGTRRPDYLEMTDFNLLTMNSKAFPATEPLVAETGALLRVRLGNLGPMEHHPIHIHGHAFQVVETDGGQIPPSARIPETTLLVPVGTVRVFETTAVAGDWPLHCHMTHHTMNQMGHAGPIMLGADTTDADRRIRKLVGSYMTMGQEGMGDMMKMPAPPNSAPMLGGDGPFGHIDMGGMFTIVKVRDRLSGSGDPGWYAHPPGTVAVAATPAQLDRDGIKLE
jgi:FtsP/CotA-like multicopper oxidase with cupredoxin domain